MDVPAADEPDGEPVPPVAVPEEVADAEAAAPVAVDRPPRCIHLQFWLCPTAQKSLAQHLFFHSC